MDNNISKELMKRIKADTIITKFITVAISLGALIYLIRLVTTILAKNFVDGNVQTFASNFVEVGFVAAAFIVLSMILGEIVKTGKPFTKRITSRFKLMAVLLIIAVPLADATATLAGFLDPNALSSGFTFTFADAMMIIFGVIIGIISEIFHYGTRLEEEIDLIA